MEYKSNTDRYQDMKYNRCGISGLKLPALSLGLWHNFGGTDDFNSASNILRRAFDAGITHFDLANNYGTPPGSAEENFGKIITSDFRAYRDELIISSKAGHLMWPGPYGEWGSRKNLLASLDQSLVRMKLQYVDIFYSHRFDPHTPLEETMLALDHAVRQGKALYAGISKYSPEKTIEAAGILSELKTPFVIHQVRYSMFERAVEKRVLDTNSSLGLGSIAFSPLAQGLLTNKYLHGIPERSRASRKDGFLKAEQVTEEKVNKAKQLNEIAEKRGQSLAQMAVSWLFRDNKVTSVLIGASSVQQLEENLVSYKNVDFSEQEITDIERILNS